MTRLAGGLLALACATHAVPDSFVHGVFGFGSGANWPHYDWKILRTLVPTESAGGMDKISQELVATAHSFGAKICPFAPGDASSGQITPPLTGDVKVRDAWVAKTVAALKEYNLDGVNFDYEKPLAAGDPRVGWYTDLVRETTAAVHAAIPGGQVSVDVAWSPNNVDGRHYDVKGLSEASDLLFIMCYDVQSQITGRCLADSNSPVSAAALGIQEFLNLSIPASKLVLGVPWFGFDYTCDDGGSTPDMASPFCMMTPLVPFRGATCSDASGFEQAYVSVRNLLDSGPSATVGPRLWDNSTATPFFNYLSKDGKRHQLWYDDPESIRAKRHVAESAGIAGFGVYEVSDLNYVVDQQGQLPKETTEMWNALQETNRTAAK